MLFAMCVAQTRLQVSDYCQDVRWKAHCAGSAIELPIELYRDYLVVVEGSIGNLGHLAFIVDTGAYPSVIDQRVSNVLGLMEMDGEIAMVLGSEEARSRASLRPPLKPFMQFSSTRLSRRFWLRGCK
jgi:hypothetical protein